MGFCQQPIVFVFDFEEYETSHQLLMRFFSDQLVIEVKYKGEVLNSREVDQYNKSQWAMFIPAIAQGKLFGPLAEGVCLDLFYDLGKDFFGYWPNLFPTVKEPKWSHEIPFELNEEDLALIADHNPPMDEFIKRSKKGA